MELIDVFSTGEMVVYKTNAVCTVEKIETPVFVKDTGKKYYKLKYLFSNGNEVVYVPIDSEVSIRRVMSEDEAKKCFDVLKNKQVSGFTAKQPALFAAHFQQLLSDSSIEGSLTVLKEILLRERKCTQEGKKLRQTEEHYLSVVEKAISEEMSVVLGKEIGEIKAMIRKAVFGE